jgi:hypothetical protein
MILSLSYKAKAQTMQNSSPITVVANSAKGYEINGKSVGKVFLLEYLEKSGLIKDQSQRVTVILLPATPLSELTNIRLIIGKIGLPNVRYFYADDEKTWMKEIIILPSIPFQLVPPTNNSLITLPSNVVPGSTGGPKRKP